MAVTSPNGGETLTIGSDVVVKYSTQLPQQTGYSYVMQVSYDGGTTWTTQRTNTATIFNGAGDQRWAVVGPPATRARLRVIYTSTAYDPGTTTSGSVVLTAPNDESDADFIIALAPQ